MIFSRMLILPTEDCANRFRGVEVAVSSHVRLASSTLRIETPWVRRQKHTALDYSVPVSAACTSTTAARSPTRAKHTAKTTDSAKNTAKRKNTDGK